MIAVNKLIQMAYESLTMTGLGEAVDGNMAVSACNELNRLISQLNGEGFLAMAQKTVECPPCRVIKFKKLGEGETAEPGTVDMEPPQLVDGVARRLGNRLVPLQNGNLFQMSMVPPEVTATQWTYDTDTEPYGDGERLVGILTLDGNPRDKVVVFYNSVLRTYSLDDTIYLSDLYNELLLAGLCWRLANFHNLSDQKKAETETDLKTAKNLIKRANISQRMLTMGTVTGDWRSAYNDFANGVNI